MKIQTPKNPSKPPYGGGKQTLKPLTPFLARTCIPQFMPGSIEHITSPTLNPRDPVTFQNFAKEPKGIGHMNGMVLLPLEMKTLLDRLALSRDGKILPQGAIQAALQGFRTVDLPSIPRDMKFASKALLKKRISAGNTYMIDGKSVAVIQNTEWEQYQKALNAFNIAYQAYEAS